MAPPPDMLDQVVISDEEDAQRRRAFPAGAALALP